MSNKKGEIATILTVGSLIVLGVVSLISPRFLQKTIKTQPRATSCSQVNSVSFSPSSINAGQTFTCSLSGSIVNQHTMACGWSKNGGWPQGQLSGRCPGNNCTFQVKMEDQVDPNASYELVGFDFRDGCGPNTGKRVPLNVAGASSQPISNQSSTNSCFNIKADIEVRPEGDKKAFYVWVTFNSDKGGDIKLEYNGIHVAGWNRFEGGNFTYSPQWTQPHTHDYEAGIAALSNDQSIEFTYRGMHSGCTPQDAVISCSAGISKNGEAWVSGANCHCRNCNDQPISSTQTSPLLTSTRSSTQPPTPTSSEEERYCYYSSYKECRDLGACEGSCIKCENEKYKCTSDISISPPRTTPIRTPTPTLTSSSTKTVDHLTNNNYSGDCKDDNNCITQETGGFSSITISVNTNLINCDNKAKISLIGIKLTDEGKVSYPAFKTYKPINLNVSETFSFLIPKIPSREIEVASLINLVKNDESIYTVLSVEKKTYSSLFDVSGALPIDYQCVSNE